MSAKIVTCVSYHHIEATTSPFTQHLGVSTSPEVFAQQLTYIKSRYQPITLDQMLGGDLPDKPLLLTIDDAYRSVHDIAAPMLAEAKIPALLMTNSRVLKGAFVPLDNVLSLALCELGPTGLGMALGLADPWSCSMQVVVRQVLPALSVDAREDMKQRLLRLLNQNEAELANRTGLFLDERQLKRLIAEHRFSIGSHTRSHVHLRALKPKDAADEIAGGKAELEAAAGVLARAFSVPYGSPRDLPPAILDIVRACGHEAVFLVKNRTNAVRPAPDVWYRQSMTRQQGLRLPAKLSWIPRIGELKAALN